MAAHAAARHPAPTRPHLDRNQIGVVAQALVRKVSVRRPTARDMKFASIRELEYSNLVPHQLRAYKAGVFQALAHPTRIAIVEILRDGELAGCGMQERLDVEQANLSQHLSILRSRQIVVNRKEGNQVFYSLRN